MVEVCEIKAFVDGNLRWDECGSSYVVDPEGLAPDQMSLAAKIRYRDAEAGVYADAEMKWTGDRVENWMRKNIEIKAAASRDKAARKAANKAKLQKEMEEQQARIQEEGVKGKE